MCAKTASGTDFMETHSPVANNITFRVALVTMVTPGSEGMIYNIKTAFLLGDLDKKMCMRCPAMVAKVDGSNGAFWSLN